MAAFGAPFSPPTKVVFWLKPGTRAMEKTENMPIWVFLAFSSIETRKGGIVAAALYAKSSALLADSLDNLGDALTYGLSIYAVSRGAVTKANDQTMLMAGINPDDIPERQSETL